MIGFGGLRNASSQISGEGHRITSSNENNGEQEK
jgi:hypothetical protein